MKLFFYNLQSFNFIQTLSCQSYHLGSGGCHLFTLSNRGFNVLSMSITHCLYNNRGVAAYYKVINFYTQFIHDNAFMFLPAYVQRHGALKNLFLCRRKFNFWRTFYFFARGGISAAVRFSYSIKQSNGENKLGWMSRYPRVLVKCFLVK